MGGFTIRSIAVLLFLVLCVIAVYFSAISEYGFSSLKASTHSDFQLVCEGSMFDYQMDDPCLVAQIRWWLHGKTFPAEGHNFTVNPPNLNGQVGAPLIVDEMLGAMEGGFFIECGAHDGEYLSNSLLFELRRNWKGLLIEPNVQTFPQLLGKNRNAFHINTCLAGGQRAHIANLQLQTVYSKVLKGHNGGKNVVQVICVPLFSLLLAVGNPTVDFFSLDIEGSEIGVLKSIPWEKVKIRVILIEVNHIDKRVVNRILTEAGYCLYDRTKYDYVYAHSLHTTICTRAKINNPFVE